MSQEEVLEVLKKHNRWMTAEEIRRIVGTSSVNTPLIKLIKQREVKRKRNPNVYYFTYLYKAI